MEITNALKLLQEERPLVVLDTTFEPSSVDQIRLESGETVYWVRDSHGMWLALDTDSDEVVVFHDIEEEFDPQQEVLMYMGSEYEFTSETSAKVLDEDGYEADTVLYRDYEDGNGSVLRLMEFEVTGDVVAATGEKVTEDDLQET